MARLNGAKWLVTIVIEGPDGKLYLALVVQSDAFDQHAVATVSLV